MNNIINYASKIIMCNILDKPIVPEFVDFNYRPSGDYGDFFANCERCGKLIHQDNHMLGNGVWEHE